MKSSPLRLLFVLAASLVLTNALGAELSGKVVSIVDGNTLTVLDSGKRQHRVRLFAIDAPEDRQSFGDVSKQNLARLAFDKTVKVEYKRKDKHGSVVGKVLIGDLDIGLQQVRDGLAWHHKRYAAEQTAVDRFAYARGEFMAREAMTGLWKERQPTAPWDFRKAAKGGKEGKDSGGGK